ncbi:MAG TPA: adenosylcobinamide-GDP ribazoletransferase, partial [Acidobacteriota bacterium]|nr:adenosylcobinamide-GDP ribazoletransferase [Acidobacteriota bacterium]
MLKLFFIAIQFLTRLPVPVSHATTEEEIGRATAFFPMVGLIVGGSAAGIAMLAHPFFPHSTCVLAALVWMTLLTNGFHEDGLADSFDGFGGGWGKDQVLTIMRDSRIGSFGSLALIFLILAKYNLLSNLSFDQVWRWLIVAHVASRWTVLPLARWLPYARPEGQGKLVAKQINGQTLVFGTLTLVGTVALILPVKIAVTALMIPLAVVILSGLYYRERIGGLTGDCLGATNQLTEVSLYVTAVALRNMFSV